MAAIIEDPLYWDTMIMLGAPDLDLTQNENRKDN